HVFGMIVAGGAQGDADARRRENFMSAEIERRRKFVLDTPRHIRSFGRVRNSVEQNSELVAAQPRDHIDFTNAALESTRDRNQQLIANRVAETIVNVLET